MIFATPDFGAGGLVILVMAAAGFVVSVLSVLWILRGVALLRRGTARGRRRGSLLILAGVLLPVSCYFVPCAALHLTYGRGPLEQDPGSVIVGMSAQDVRAALGPPHQVRAVDGEESWIYLRDTAGLGWFAVHFGADGRVKSTARD
jgi:hypothetical protein